MENPDPSGLTVLITAGDFAGCEGVCLGRVEDGTGRWAVSPHGSVQILELNFPADFGVLVNSGQDPGRN